MRTDKDWDALVKGATVPTIKVTVTNAGGLVRYTAQSRDEQVVEDWGLDLLERYDPMGYGTTVSEPRFYRKTGVWWSEASRYSSAGG